MYNKIIDKQSTHSCKRLSVSIISWRCYLYRSTRPSTWKGMENDEPISVLIVGE